jgi:hypothetical protein
MAVGCFIPNLINRAGWKLCCSVAAGALLISSMGCGGTRGMAQTPDTGSITLNGAVTADGNNLNGIDFGEAAFAPNNADVSSSKFEFVGPQMHFRLSRAYCDKRSVSLQSASDQANFFCPPNIPDAVVIDDQHPPSSTPNKAFIIAPYQSGMSISYPSIIEVSSEIFSIRANNLSGPTGKGAELDVGDDFDLGGHRLTSFAAVVTGSDGNVHLDRSQSFVEFMSESFATESHGDMLFAVRDPLDGFRFQLVPPHQEERLPNGGYKAFTVARIDSTGKGFFDGGTQTGGADFAESVSPAGPKADYEPGDVLVIDPSSDGRFRLSNTPYSSLVAGIYSTKPGVIGSSHRSEDPKLAAEIPMAIVGIVPCKVSAENGPISRGDLLVTSSTPGYAMRGTDKPGSPAQF